MYIKTLELLPPAQILFRKLQNWRFLTFMNRFGISRFIASQSAAGVFTASAAIGMIVIPDIKE